MAKIYAFTNENVNSYKNLYNFDNSKVLSVLGSGDQYFTSILNGAKEVELYDINNDAWDYFVLKFYSILILSYEEFFDFFINRHTYELKYFEKVKKYLPTDVLNRLEKSIGRYGEMFLDLDYLDIAHIEFDKGNIIPYLKKEEYYKLQSLLRSRKLPTFYNENLLNLPNVLNDTYDLVMLSNIFYWIHSKLNGSNEEDKINSYKKFLSNFNSSDIQAVYFWGTNKKFELFNKSGFQIDEVPRARDVGTDTDYVATLKRC